MAKAAAKGTGDASGDAVSEAGAAPAPKRDAAPRVAAYVPVDKLVPYARNARLHSDKQIELIAKSIRRFGWTQPVLAVGAELVAGHGRVLAARLIYDAGDRIRLPDGSLLPMGCVPVIDCTGWSEEDKRTYVLVDNELAAQSEWDQGLLDSELDALAKDGDLLGDLFNVGDGEEEEGEGGPEMPEVTPVEDEFWITLSGPMEHQARALQIIRQNLALWPTLRVDQGVTHRE